MQTYVTVDATARDLRRCVRHRHRDATAVLERLRAETGAAALYVRARQRYVLESILHDIGWRNRRIAVPTYTCPTVHESVRKSGNVPVRYRIRRDLQVDEASLAAVLEGGISAIVISDVFGLRMGVPRDLGSSPQPLLIGDLAHHDSFAREDDDRAFDIVLYSSAYYKPLQSMGAGIGVVLNPGVGLSDSIAVDHRLAANMTALVRYLAIGRTLSSRAARAVYAWRVRRGHPGTVDYPADRSGEPCVGVSLAQLACRFDSTKRERATRIARYREALSDLDWLTLVDGEDRGTPPTYVPALVEGVDRDALVLRTLRRGLLLGRTFAHPPAATGDPAASALAASVLNLPMTPGHIDPDRCAAILRAAWQELRFGARRG